MRYEFEFDVNLSILFTELPLLARPEAAARCGFDAVELWWPFSGPVPQDHEHDLLVEALASAGTKLVALNFDAGDMASGDRGLLSLPKEKERFRSNIDAVMALAQATGCRVLNALYGNRDRELDAGVQDDVAMENLLMAAEAARNVGAVVVLEALNTFENPTYPLSSTASTIALIEKARLMGAENVALLADLYHLARMGERLDDSLLTAGKYVRHVQIADIPDRHEPGSGKLGREGLLGPLERARYRGRVGLEYRPSLASERSFDWLALRAVDDAPLEGAAAAGNL